MEWTDKPLDKEYRKWFISREDYMRYSIKPSLIDTFDEVEVSSERGRKLGGEQEVTRDSEQSEEYSSKPCNEIDFMSLDASDKSNVPNPVKQGQQQQKQQQSNQLTSVTGNQEISLQNETLNIKKQGKWMQAKMGLKVLFPRPSTMTRLEQKTYLELCYQFRHQPLDTPVDHRLLNQFKELQMKVLAEQKEYSAYLEDSARQLVTDYNAVHPAAEQFVGEYIERRRQRVYQYPRYYIVHDTVSLPQIKYQADVTFTHTKNLLEMGTVTKVILPNSDGSLGNSSAVAVHLPLDYKKVSQRYPQCSTESSMGGSGYSKTVSRDETMEKLVLKHEADIAISLSGLLCILDNHLPSYCRQWEMAVTIKEYDITNDGKTTKRKVVYVDSPFIPKAITPHEKNLIYNKFALKTLLLHPSHPNSCQLESKSEYFRRHLKHKDINPHETASINIFSDVAEDLSSLEVFGTESREPSKSSSRTKTLPVSNDDKEDNDSDIDCDIDVGSDNLSICSAPHLVNEEDIVRSTHHLVNEEDIVRSTHHLVNEEDIVRSAPHLVNEEDIVPPLSPILCVDGLVDDKAKIEEGDGDGRGFCNRKRNSSSPKKLPCSLSNTEDSAGHALRRSTRLAAKISIPNYGLSDSDSEDSLVIDFSSPKPQSFGSSPILFDFSSPKPQTLGLSPILFDFPSPKPQTLGSSPTASSSAMMVTRSRLRHESQSLSEETLISGLTKRALESDSSEIISCDSEVKAKEDASLSSTFLVEPDRKRQRKKSQLLKDSDIAATESCSGETLQQPVNLSTCDMSSSLQLLGKSLDKKTDLAETEPCLDSELNNKDVASAEEKNQKTEIADIEIKTDESCSKAQTEVQVSVSTTKEGKRKRGRPPKRQPSVKSNKTEELAVNADTEQERKDNKQILEKAELKNVGQMSNSQKIVQTSVSSAAVSRAKAEVETQVTAPQQTDSNSFLDKLLSDQSRMFDKTVSKPLAAQKSFRHGHPLASTELSQIPIQAGVKIVEPQPGTGDTVTAKSLPNAPFQSFSNAAQKLSASAVDGVAEALDEMSENAEEYAQPSAGNIAYHLWNLNGIKLIVRHHHQGVLQPYRNKQPYFVHFAPKLEHQVEHGAEQTTISEIIRSWAALHIKQKTRLIRARINASTSEVFLFENLDQNQVLQGLNPSSSFCALNSVLEKLTKMSPGSYLVGHMPGNPYVQIKKSTQSERGVYDLHLAYKSTEIVLMTPNQPTSCYWIPIDTSIQLQYHSKFFRIPGTFEPYDTALVNTMPRKNTKKKGKQGDNTMPQKNTKKKKKKGKQSN